MKALHPLTEEQRIFAEKHHDFIYQYLNGRHLNIEVTTIPLSLAI